MFCIRSVIEHSVFTESSNSLLELWLRPRHVKTTTAKGSVVFPFAPTVMGDLKNGGKVKEIML